MGTVLITSQSRPLLPWVNMPSATEAATDTSGNLPYKADTINNGAAVGGVRGETAAAAGGGRRAAGCSGANALRPSSSFCGCWAASLLSMKPAIADRLG